MLKWFENLVDPFAREDVERPPTDLTGFFTYFMWPVRRLLLAIVIVSLVTSATEMALFVFLGNFFIDIVA